MKYFAIVAILLAGCAELPPEDQQLLQTLQAYNHKLVTDFNVIQAKPFPEPEIRFGSCGNDCDALSHRDIIFVDLAKCRADLVDCETDTLPHEDAHIAEDFYYPNIGRHMRNFSDEHDRIWCGLMRDFGGLPEKHGYCNLETH